MVSPFSRSITSDWLASRSHGRRASAPPRRQAVSACRRKMSVSSSGSSPVLAETVNISASRLSRDGPEGSARGRDQLAGHQDLERQPGPGVHHEDGPTLGGAPSSCLAMRPPPRDRLPDQRLFRLPHSQDPNCWRQTAGNVRCPSTPTDRGDAADRKHPMSGRSCGDDPSSTRRSAWSTTPAPRHGLSARSRKSSSGDPFASAGT